jgi:hypothetical protein
MRFYNRQHRHYCGIDLHVKTMYTCILDAVVKGTDLLRPAVESARRATVSESARVHRGPLQCHLRFQRRLPSRDGSGSQHLLRLKLRAAKREGRET